MDPIEEIKNRLDIVDIVSEAGVQLRHSGRSYTGFCPFHANTRTPAFVVFPDSQGWHCFGACAEGGDIFSFVMKRYGWDFREALEQLARRAGVTLEERPAPQQQQADTHLHDLMEAAADYFHQLLLHAPQAEHARQYIGRRQLTAETIASFSMGYALESWDACRTHFLNQGYSEQELFDVGLLTENPEKGTRYDRFRNRLMVPIRDTNGRTVGFGARTLDPDGQPKYLNSPQTFLFDKSHLLFGLDMAKRHIREARQVVIVEGYMDVIQAWQGGFRNVVAQMGTALTESQLNLLKRLTKRFVIALDADAAGAKATLRGLAVARQTLDREMEVQFDPHGLIKHEGRLEADIRIVTMPAGEDPDSIIRRDPAQWPLLLEKAKPVVAYVIGVLATGLDLNDVRAKEDVAKQVVPLIQDVASPIERDHYWHILGRALDVDDKILRRLPTAETRSAPRPTAASTAEKSPPKKPGLLRDRRDGVRQKESHFLACCLINMALLPLVDELLAAQQQTAVGERDFSSVEDQLLLRHLRRQPNLVHGDGWRKLEMPLQKRLETLMSAEPEEESNPEKLATALALSVLDWRLFKANQINMELKLLIREPLDSEAKAQYTQQHLLLAQQIGRLNRAKGALRQGFAANKR